MSLSTLLNQQSIIRNGSSILYNLSALIVTFIVIGPIGNVYTEVDAYIYRLPSSLR